VAGVVGRWELDLDEELARLVDGAQDAVPLGRRADAVAAVVERPLPRVPAPEGAATLRGRRLTRFSVRTLY